MEVFYVIDFGPCELYIWRRHQFTGGCFTRCKFSDSGWAVYWFDRTYRFGKIHIGTAFEWAVVADSWYGLF